MVLPLHFWLLFAAAMIISSIGFKNYVWFISLGYGFSIAGEGLLMLLLYGKSLTPGTIICCVLFILYGIRLGGYLAIREFKSSSYKKNMTGEIKDGKTIPFGVKIAIWVTCAALYVTQVSPVFYRLLNGSGSNIWTYIGAAVIFKIRIRQRKTGDAQFVLQIVKIHRSHHKCLVGYDFRNRKFIDFIQQFLG